MHLVLILVLVAFMQFSAPFHDRGVHAIFLFLFSILFGFWWTILNAFIYITRLRIAYQCYRSRRCRCLLAPLHSIVYGMNGKRITLCRIIFVVLLFLMCINGVEFSIVPKDASLAFCWFVNYACFTLRTLAIKCKRIFVFLGLKWPIKLILEFYDVICIAISNFSIWRVHIYVFIDFEIDHYPYRTICLLSFIHISYLNIC